VRLNARKIDLEARVPALAAEVRRIKRPQRFTGQTKTDHFVYG